MLSAAAAALLLLGASSTALSQPVTVSTDISTQGNWIGKFGSCAYVLPAQKDAPGIETPILPGTGICSTATCPGGVPPITGNAGNYFGGATSDLQDCRGQTSTGGVSDLVKYNVRLCSAWPGGFPPVAQGYVWPQGGCMVPPGGFKYNSALQFPTDPRGLASCTPLGAGCTAKPNGRIPSTWDDAGELFSTPVTGAGVCVDIDLSSISAADRAHPYKLSSYFLDYDDVGRDLTVQLFNATTSALLASSPIGGFNNGAYVSFNNLNPLPSALTLQINRSSAADVNAVISGLFLDRSDAANCAVAPPAIALKKLTNGVDTPNPNDGLAPQVVPGSTVTWTYIVTNTGQENLINVAVNDDKVGFICTVGALNIGASATCTKTGIAQLITAPPGVMGVCGGVPNRPLYENMGAASGTGATSGIPVNAHYTSHYCNTPPPPPGSFTLTKTPKNATYNIGQNISFTMVVASTGPGAALNVQLSDILPTLGNLNSWAITANPGGCSIAADNKTLSCSFGDLANGQTRSVTVATTAVGGADASACPGGVKLNNTASATSTGLSPKFDTGDYVCTPPVPNVSIIKFTNGADANDPNAAGVPNVAPGGTVTWTYRVTNTGQTSVPRAQVVVTDNVTGVTPAFISEISGNGDTIFNPGEVWLYSATGTALDLTLPPPAGNFFFVQNSCSAGGTQPPTTAYTNIGKVTIPGATASDPSSYCNPPPIPCPAGSFTFSVDANGNLNIKFDQFPAPNDNSYGANAVGWGTKGHKFQDLVGSDHAGFQIVNPSGTVVLDFNIDYITATTASALFPSGYKSFGPFGGDGKVNVGTLVDQTDITYTSSLANNLNNINIPGLFSGGVQQFGTGVANVLIDSPPTVDKISNYTLTPAAMAAGFNGWDFHDTYFVQLKKAKLVAIGYLNAATNQPNPGWTVRPNLDALHNSPAKPCPTAGGGVCAIDAGATTIKDKTFKWELTNTGTAAAVLTDVSITWPAANGKLVDIKLDGDKVYDVDTLPPSVTLTSAQLVTDANKKTIGAGKTRVFTLDFQNNAATSLASYAITLKFNGTGCTVTFDGTNPSLTLGACSDLKPIEQMVLEYSGTTAIQNVAFYRTSATGVPGAADLIGNTGPLAQGDVFSFGDYDAANATNDVDFQITFVGGATQKSRFHLSCSDPDMQDIGDCGKLEGNGKVNDVAGGNLWLLRDLQGKGKHMCNFP